MSAPCRLERGELLRVAGWSLLVMLVTCIPYLRVWWSEPLGAVFPGVLFNSDDHGVYFAWMRQAADGRILFHNLFTAEPQPAVYFHGYFLLLGWLARLPGLDIPLAYHLGRVVSGVVTLVLVFRLSVFFAPDRFTRGCIFWTTALSAGLGWLFWSETITPMSQPVDAWQPEALTGLSLYANGLFAVSLGLILGVVICLLLAEERGWRWAVGAGLCGLALGNVHSYDVIHLALAWGAYLAIRGFVDRRFPTRALGHALIAAAVAAPAVLYMVWLYLTQPIFRARADTATLSPGLHYVLLGYGLLLPLAAWGAVLLLRTQKGRHLLPVVWAVSGFAAAYLPFAFQRKMIMGTHLPLALLAGLAVAELSRRAGRPRLAPLLAAVMVGALSVTTVRFALRDVGLALDGNRTSTAVHPCYWPGGTIAAFRGLHAASPEGTVLLTYPLNGVFAPAYSGRSVWAGHWAETPDFARRVRTALSFYRGRMTAAERQAFLRGEGITHVLWSPFESAAAGVGGKDLLDGDPSLRAVFREGEAVLYEVATR